MSDPFLLMASFGLLLFAAARQLDRRTAKGAAVLPTACFVGRSAGLMIGIAGIAAALAAWA